MDWSSDVCSSDLAGIGPLYTTLCSQQAPFASIAKDEFDELVRHLGRKRLLMQDGGGDLLLGEVGEKIVHHYSFYAAFSSDEEFRLFRSEERREGQERGSTCRTHG